MHYSTELPYDFHNAVKNTFALVLAGGRGTRLMQLTDDEAKPAMPFGGKFRIVDFPLSNCINSGIRQIAVLTQYKAHTLIQHVQRGWGFLRAGSRPHSSGCCWVFLHCASAGRTLPSPPSGSPRFCGLWP